MKVLSSAIKGCFSAILVVFIVVAVILMIRSTKEPIEIFDFYRIDNLIITRM
jgi:hypothetical protein